MEYHLRKLQQYDINSYMLFLNNQAPYIFCLMQLILYWRVEYMYVDKHLESPQIFMDKNIWKKNQ